MSVDPRTIPICSAEASPWYIILLRCVNIGACVLVVLVNAFILAALWFRRRSQSHKARSNLFVINLALCGFLGGCSSCFYLAVNFSCEATLLFSSERALCEFQLVIFIFNGLINISALGVVALDRYLLIVHSLRYRAIMTGRRAIWMIGAAWVISSLCALAVLFSNRFNRGMVCREETAIPAWHLLAVQVPMNVLILVVITATHLRMRSEAQRNHQKHMELVGKTIGCEQEKISKKSARVVTQAVACYFVAFMPLQVVLILEVMNVGDESKRSWAFCLCVPFFTLSYLINPLLYTCKNLHLREDLRNTWKDILDFVKSALKCSTDSEMHTLRI